MEILKLSGLNKHDTKYGMRSYPQREELLMEVHSRPFQLFETPLNALHLAALYEDASAQATEQQVLAAVQQLGFDVDAAHRGFLFVSNPHHAIRYEPHNEFYTLTLYHLNPAVEAISAAQLYPLLPGALLVELAITCEKAPARTDAQRTVDKPPTLHPDEQTRYGFTDGQFCAALVMNGAARVATDFRTDSHQRIHMQVCNIRLQPARTGRLLQRLCELETYRNMALLSLPIARELMPKITRLDQQLARITDQRNDSDLSDQLIQMTDLAAEVESISAATANRFSASDAYFAMVDRILQELQEQKIEGAQTIGEFMDRHLRPARRTCNSAAARTELLSRRIGRATELMQSQVSLKIEEQNRELLEALNDRTQRKMSLESKLEILSVVVVVYYLYDLADLALKNLLHKGELLENLLTALTLSLPLLIISVALVIRRLLRGYRDE
ncbi:MAG: DUF3422 domain-containing protein [Marinobacterium sp.]|nr:DUF3422 domain-containing protein [Marinobacterium sp.]